MPWESILNNKQEEFTMRKRKGTPVVFIIIFVIAAAACIGISAALPESLPAVYKKLMFYVGTPVMAFLAVYLFCRLKGR